MVRRMSPLFGLSRRVSFVGDHLTTPLRSEAISRIVRHDISGCVLLDALPARLQDVARGVRPTAGILPPHDCTRFSACCSWRSSVIIACTTSRLRKMGGWRKYMPSPTGLPGGRSRAIRFPGTSGVSSKDSLDRGPGRPARVGSGYAYVCCGSGSSHLRAVHLSHVHHDVSSARAHGPSHPGTRLHERPGWCRRPSPSGDSSALIGWFHWSSPSGFGNSSKAPFMSRRRNVLELSRRISRSGFIHLTVMGQLPVCPRGLGRAHRRPVLLWRPRGADAAERNSN